MVASDDDLLIRATRGDRESLATLLERYSPALRRGLVGKMPKRWRSLLCEDDVIQQTLTDAFLDIDQFVPQGKGSFGAWLATLANRNLLDTIRMLEAEKRGGNRRRVELQASGKSLIILYELVGATTDTPSRIVARDEAKAAIERAIRRLPETHRRVVEMYDLEGRPIGEVAATLNRSSGAIFMLRTRAHRRIGEIMGTESDFLSV